MSIIGLGILAGYCSLRWLAAESAGLCAAILLERHGIYPSDDEIHAASREAWKRIFSRRK